MSIETNPSESSAPPPPLPAVLLPGCVFGLVDPSGRGVYAIRPYREGEIVLAGHVDGEFPRDRHPLRQVTLDEAAVRGGLLGQVAHSCAPSCGVRMNAVGTHDLVARYSIRPGSEITVDYAMRSFSIDLFPAHCQCGTVGCRGAITGFKDLPHERKLAYQGLVAPHLLLLDSVPNQAQSR